MHQVQPSASRSVLASGVPRGWLVGWLIGIAGLIAGAFLPWLYSGTVPKNSFQVVGVGQRWLPLPGWATTLLQAWPFVGVLWALVVTAMLVGRRRLAAWISVGLASASLLVVGVVLVTGSQLTRGVSLAYAGPLVCFAAAVLVLVAGWRLSRR